MKHKTKRKVHTQIKKIRKSFLKIDKPLLGIVSFWLLFGVLVFVSASLGLVAKDTGILSKVLTKQILTILISFVAMLIVAKIKFKKILRATPYIYAFSIFLSLLVFVPGLAFSAGGASRWIIIGGTSLQPSEFMKFATVLFAVYLFVNYRNKFRGDKMLFIPGLALMVPGLILALEPDTSTILITTFGLGVFYFLAGGSWKSIAIGAAVGIVALSILILTHPYIKDRIFTFMDAGKDVLGKGYQINQSLIAIGSGGVFGKGFGQGVQKFGYLPEPVGDAIFATIAEEFGFLGALVLLTIITLFILRAFKLSKKAKSSAQAIIILVFASMIFVQAFVNIAAMSGVMPLTGLTLPLISLGGTSMLSTMLAIGIIFSAAKKGSIL